MNKNQGPLLTDAEFFGNLLNIDQKASPSLSDAIRRADYAACRVLFADSYIQGDFRPIYVLKYILKGQNLRHVTLLLPKCGEADVISGVEVSSDVSDTRITLRLSCGREVCFDESEWLER